MFNEKILKVAKKLLDRKNVNQIQGAMHYNVSKNLLTITDSFVLAEIKMLDEYKGKFDDLLVSDITIDYYTACWLLAMIEHPDAYWKIAWISLGNATVQDFIEYEYADLRSCRNWIRVRLPIIETHKLWDYKEERLFDLWEDNTTNIAVTSSFEKFQAVCWCLLDTDIPIIKVSENTYIAEWKVSIDDLWFISLDARICVTRNFEKQTEELKKQKEGN